VRVNIGGAESSFEGTISAVDSSCGTCGPCACTLVTSFEL
jgi:hypothetical protein